MDREKNIEIYSAPGKKLRDKLFTGKLDAPTIPPELISRMEDTLDALKADFRDWVSDDVARLRSVLARIRKMQGANEDTVNEVREIALNLKNLGGTFDFPLISSISISLLNYSANKKVLGPLDLGVFQTHLESMLLVFREDMTGDGSGAGEKLLANLGALVKKAKTTR